MHIPRATLLHDTQYVILDGPAGWQPDEWAEILASIAPAPDSPLVEYRWEVQTFGAVVDTQQIEDTLRVGSAAAGTLLKNERAKSCQTVVSRFLCKWLHYVFFVYSFRK